VRQEQQADICALCGSRTRLVDSHIIPRFIFHWLKETGSGYLRTAGQPNRRVQDGHRCRLLCEDCEARFSRYEKFFAEEFHRAYVDRRQFIFPYDDRLALFIVSILWRVLVTERDGYLVTFKNRFQTEITRAEQEWRAFLLGQADLVRFSRLHLFVTDITNQDAIPVQRFNSYLARGVDLTIAWSQDDALVYAKFGRFVLVAYLTSYDDSDWEGTLVSQAGGVLAVPQKLGDGRFGAFLLDRARRGNELFERGLSPKQRDVIDRAAKRYMPEILHTDQGRVLNADFGATVKPLLPDRKVGRNELCPCGSGVKYKRCHLKGSGS